VNLLGCLTRRLQEFNLPVFCLENGTTVKIKAPLTVTVNVPVELAREEKPALKFRGRGAT